MYSIFEAFAKYNLNVNSFIMKQLVQLSASQLNKPENFHYKSIAGLLTHVMQSDFRWLGRLSFIRKVGANFENLVSEDSDKAAFFSENIDKVASMRLELDREILLLTETLIARDLTEMVEIDFGGKKISLVFWKLLLQWFNHQTHHRGQLSVMLDLQGIENDFSMVLDKI